MQQKGEREIMTNGECCRYIRTYSELEGLQHACTLVYCAATTPQGVLAQLRREQGGKVRSSTVLAPADSFGRVMRLIGIGVCLIIQRGRSSGWRCWRMYTSPTSCWIHQKPQ